MSPWGGPGPGCRIWAVGSGSVLLAVALPLLIHPPAGAIEVGEGATDVRVSSALELGPEGAVTDWGYGIIEVPAASALAEPTPAARAAGEARRLAVARLGAALRAVRLVGDLTLGDAADRLPALAADLNRIAARADIASESLGDDGRVTATARLDLFADAAGVAEAALVHLGSEVSADSRAASSELAVMTQSVLTVDARGFGLQPCLFPRFLLSDGTPLRTRYADAIRTNRCPPVTYVRTREDLSRRQGDRLVTHVRAAGVGGMARTDVVLLRPVDLEMPREIIVLF